jgi:hypothetical protein
MIYDDSCRGRRLLPGLTHSWIAGALLYGARGKLDAWRGCRSWGEALEWLGTVQPDRPIAEIQFWGHGKWGRAMIDGERLDRTALRHGSEHYLALSRLRARITGPSGLWWFRTCETFGANVGHDFARAWTDFFGCRAAGHTYIIGPWQSGLHALGPGDPIDWDAAEGLEAGTVDAPSKALWSKPTEPNTISCLHGSVPDWAWSRGAQDGRG